MNELLWWAAQNTISVAVLLPVVAIACWLLRSRPAVQHLLWLLLLLKLVAPPVVQWPWAMQDLLDAVKTPFQRLETQTPDLAVHSVTKFITTTQILDNSMLVEFPLDERIDEAIEPQLVQEPVADWSVAQATLLAWAVGATVVVALAVRSIARQAGVLRTARAPSAMLLAAVQRAAERLRVRPVGAAFSARVASPLICCLGRPRLVWPQALNAPDLIAASDGIIAHELAHVARRDHLVVYLELLALALHWWNPLAWYIRRQLRETRELACDALALADAEQPRADYAQRLLAMSTARMDAMTLAPAFGAGTFSRRFLQRRLTMVFDNRTSGRVSPVGLALAALLGAAALPGLSWAYPSDDAAPVANPAAAPAASISDAPPAPGESTAAVSLPADVTAVPVLSEISYISEVFVTGQPSADNSPAKPVDATKPIQQVIAYDSKATPVNQSVIDLSDGGALDIQRTGDNHLILTIRRKDGAQQVLSYVLATEHVSGPTVAATLRDTVEWAPATDPTADYRPVAKQYQAQVREVSSDRDLDLAKSDVELAEVNLEEKKAELDILEDAAAEGIVPAGKLRLAKLAVRRAEIELQRRHIMLGHSVNAPTTQLQSK